MKKIKRAKVLQVILLIILLAAFATLSVVTYAWFTDKKEYSGDLSFGTIELDVTGAGVNNQTKSLTFDITRASGPEYSGKVMPGDTVNIGLTVGLKSTSEPAYYLAYIYDNYGVFEDAVYFSDDGTNVYVNDGTKTYLQSDANKASVSNKYVGKLTYPQTHNLTISAKVSEDYETQNTMVTINCKIYAIQQANLTEQEAFNELNPKVNFVSTWKDDLVSANVGISNASSLTKLAFKTSSDVDTGVYQDTTKTLGTTGIKIYQNKTVSTDIVFASDKIIMAPENCSSMFFFFTSLTSLDFSNFNTSKVTNMSDMFGECISLTSLDLANFNTSKVTDMSYMFEGCSKLTSLDLSNFNTSSVTNMGGMLMGCSGLTSLDVSNFNTSKVTNMLAMFQICSKLTSLDVSNFNTSKVGSMEGMFESCSSLTSLDLSSFNTSSVTNMSGMFSNTFSNSPSTSTLNISSNFTYKVGEVNTQFASKTELNTQTSLNTNVSVLKDGVALS